MDNAGNAEPFGDAEAETIVDAAPPTAEVEPLVPLVNEESFTVAWTGSDGGSGIRCYDIQYRLNAGPWELWQDCTAATSATFTAAEDGVYEFEARAQDNVGNVEDFTGQPEAGVLVDARRPFLQPRAWFPIAIKDGQP